ncbi:IniB N-terminal domain-containing protein [Arthrobacter sp. MPF02]|uniref:IniB N-terminal domain-containing protein n=1 Tax=Arthrobacter sp. MPF02 TaxID=3388492 RepID=UPI003984748C
MTLANDLVQFLMHLFGDRQAAQDFLDNPEKVLEDHGLGKVCSADVDAAMPVVLDYAPVTINASRFDREYNTGGNDARTDHNGGGGGSTGGGNHGGGHHHGGGRDNDHDDHAHAVQQLHHVVNNYSYTSTVDDRDTIVDQSVNQNIWADGDVEQWFDNDSVVASGDRAVAAGDDAYVKDSNNIEDSYNTDNSTDNSIDNSVTAGRDANIGNEETNIDDSFNTDVDIDADIDDSFNEDSQNDNSDHSDNSTNIDVRDSGNDNSINDSFNDEIDNSINDSGNTEVDLDNVGNTDNSINDSGNTELEVDIEDSFQDNSTETNTNIEDNVIVADNEVDYTNVEDNTVVADNEFEFTEDNSINTDVNVEDNNLAFADDEGEATAG